MASYDVASTIHQSLHIGTSAIMFMVSETERTCCEADAVGTDE